MRESTIALLEFVGKWESQTIKSSIMNYQLVTLKMASKSTSVTHLELAKICALLLALSPLGLLFSHAQYSSPLLAPSSANLISNAPGYCDSARLLRCQQDVARDMQLVGLNAASIQYPISSGPPYSPAAKLREQQQQQQQQQGSSQATCRLVRSNLDCLLNTTPACFETGLQAALSSDVILRAKRFLEQSGCNEPDQSWQVTLCYRAPEVRACEERYGFTVFGSSAVQVANSSTCLAYQAFKYCIDSHARLNCKVYEIDMANEYLIDRAGDLAWRCPHLNSTSSSSSSGANLHYGHYGLSNGPSGAPLSPISAYNSLNNYNRDNYEQRPIPTYTGSSGNSHLFGGSARDQPWERFRSPYDDSRFGISRLPAGGSGEVFDRLVAGSPTFDADSSDCPVKAAPYARECEDTLVEQQRMARDSRDGNELQRRICCSLFQYRDCISRVVLDRCADSSPAAVEILMGMRRREMVLTCRGFNRDFCSGALALVASPLLIVAVSLVTAFMTFKRQLCQ